MKVIGAIIIQVATTFIALDFLYRDMINKLYKYIITGTTDSSKECVIHSNNI